MMLRRSLFLMVLLTAIMGQSAAVLVEEVHSSYVPYQTIPYGIPQNHTVPLFDSSKETLLQVDVNLSVNGSQFIGYENLQSFGFILNTSAFYGVGTILPNGVNLTARVYGNYSNSLSAAVGY